MLITETSNTPTLKGGLRLKPHVTRRLKTAIIRLPLATIQLFTCSKLVINLADTLATGLAESHCKPHGPLDKH